MKGYFLFSNIMLALFWLDIIWSEDMKVSLHEQTRAL